MLTSNKPPSASPRQPISKQSPPKIPPKPTSLSKLSKCDVKLSAPLPYPRAGAANCGANSYININRPLKTWTVPPPPIPPRKREGGGRGKSEGAFECMPKPNAHMIDSNCKVLSSTKDKSVAGGSHLNEISTVLLTSSSENSSYNQHSSEITPASAKILKLSHADPNYYTKISVAASQQNSRSAQCNQNFARLGNITVSSDSKSPQVLQNDITSRLMGLLLPNGYYTVGSQTSGLLSFSPNNVFTTNVSNTLPRQSFRGSTPNLLDCNLTVATSKPPDGVGNLSSEITIETDINTTCAGSLFQRQKSMPNLKSDKNCISVGDEQFGVDDEDSPSTVGAQIGSLVEEELPDMRSIEKKV